MANNWDAEPEDQKRQVRWLCFWTLMFFLVYVAIHYVLNDTAQGMLSPGLPLPETNEEIVKPGAAGAAATEIRLYTGWKKLIIELSGPITISICSSLLIMSYGAFLIHGLRHLSVSLPTAFFTAFLIFVVGQIAVQIVGHLEIGVTNYSFAHPNSSPPSWLALPSAFSYAIAFFALYILENYEYRVFAKLKEQLPPGEKFHAHDAQTMARLTIVSVLLIFLKLAIVKLDPGAKFGMVMATLAAETVIAIIAVIHLWHRSMQRTRP